MEDSYSKDGRQLFDERFRPAVFPMAAQKTTDSNDTLGALAASKSSVNGVRRSVETEWMSGYAKPSVKKLQNCSRRLLRQLPRDHLQYALV